MCPKEAVVKCQCNTKNYCKKDFDKHSSKKGDHQSIKINDALGPKKTVSFLGNDEHKSETEEPAEVTIKSGQKEILKAAIEKELAKLLRFKTKTLACISSQQQSLISSIITESKNMTAKILADKAEKVEQLKSTISELDVIGKIPVGNPIIERLKKLTPGQSILTLSKTMTKVEINLEKLVDFKISWLPNPVIDEIKSYYNVNSANIPARLKKLYEKIFSEKHYMLKKLSLGKAKLDKHSLEYFKKIVFFYSKIKELKLGNNKISSENSELLAECLVNFKNLEKLDASSNDLRGHGIEVLTPVFEDMKNLTVLSIAKNNLGATGARHLSLMLESLKKIKDLDLDGNGFGSEGARYLSGALPKLLNLKILKLRNNNFADDSVRFLKVAFGKMQVIEVIKLEGNNFGNEEKRTMQLIARKECKIEF